MQHSLPLLSPASHIPWPAVLTYLSNMPADSEPALYLAVILLRHAAALVVATVPLEPAARIGRVNPAFSAPLGKRLTRIYTEVVERRIVLFVTQLCMCKPVGREFILAIGHVFAAKDAECEHLFGRQLWLESRIEILPFRFAESIGRHLHGVVHVNRCRPFSRCVHLLILAQPNYEVRNFVLRNSCLVLRHQARLDTRSLFLVKNFLPKRLVLLALSPEEECIEDEQQVGKDGRWMEEAVFRKDVEQHHVHGKRCQDNGSQSRAVDCKQDSTHRTGSADERHHVTHCHKCTHKCPTVWWIHISCWSREDTQYSQYRHNKNENEENTQDNAKYFHRDEEEERITKVYRWQE